MIVRVHGRSFGFLIDAEGRYQMICAHTLRSPDMQDVFERVLNRFILVFENVLTLEIGTATLI